MLYCAKFIAILTFVVLSFSCGSNNNNQLSSLKAKNNLIKPSLIIFPSDALLKRLRCLTKTENQGTISYIRDYKKAFIKDSELKFIISSIEEIFATNGYPVENLEQQLKQIENENAIDDIESISKDSKTLLVNNIKPDFIIEIDYESQQDPNSRNPKKLVDYLLSARDVYTNKTVASVTEADINNPDNKSTMAIIKSNIEDKKNNFLAQLNQRFKDINQNGVEITLRITIDNNANLNLTDECLGSENYNDYINAWLKSNTLNQSYTPIKNTDKEIRYTNIRIKSKTSEGEKYLAYDFANDLKKDLSKGCGILVINKTQGIGDAYITVKGIK